jgi:hypothetical protein
MRLNENTPWPKTTDAVPCTQAHTAEVILADNHYFSRYWAAGAAFPGSKSIIDAAHKACNSAFASYVGIAFSQSKYTWADVIPDQSTWPSGDRGLHCVAYWSTTKQPAGVTLTESIKGSRA